MRKFKAYIFLPYASAYLRDIFKKQTNALHLT